MRRLVVIISILLFAVFVRAEDDFIGYDHLTCRLKVMENSFELGKPILVDFQVKNKGYQQVM